MLRFLQECFPGKDDLIAKYHKLFEEEGEHEPPTCLSQTDSTTYLSHHRLSNPLTHPLLLTRPTPHAAPRATETDLEALLLFQESDLKELGIKIGPRKKVGHFSRCRL